MTADLGHPGQVADSYVDGLTVLNPRAAQAMGQQTDRLWAAPGPEEVEQRAALARDGLRQLDQRPAGESEESAPARVLRRALGERLHSEMALHDSGFIPGLVAPLASPAHEVVMGLESAAGDADLLIGGLAQVPDALRSYAARLDHAAAGGYVVAARQSRTLAAQLRRWADPARDDRLGRLLTPETAPRAETELAAARAACVELATWLEDVHAARGSEVDAVGPDLYRATSTAFLGKEIDLAEAYAFGWDRLTELTRQGEQLAARLGCSSMDEAAAMLDADASGHVRVGPPLVQWVEDRIARAHGTLDGTIFDIPADSRCGAVLAAPGSGSIYYSPPDPAGTRPGRVVWSTPTGATELPVWREVSTVHHEGVPGHHLQYVMTMSTQALHPWQRYLCHIHGYAEGWAHYTEGRAGDWGLIADPGEQLGVVLAQRWRAARIVIDMGLHLGYEIPAGNGFTQATTWTTDVGVQVLTQAAGCDTETARFEVVRYLGWPGQALAFSMGAKLWEDARSIALATGRFDERSFHQQALSLGPMGLGPLQQTLEELARA
ncbi:DUF885 domain-containing protein [Pseudactinotalea sp. Z1732]|uniref:DUF885 domain-containing protein n=1 Tax=Pseudactinotalea sp. Z1732 TaxID=3413026 RepID=UPI003C7B7E19